MKNKQTNKQSLSETVLVIIGLVLASILFMVVLFTPSTKEKTRSIKRDIINYCKWNENYKEAFQTIYHNVGWGHYSKDEVTMDMLDDYIYTVSKYNKNLEAEEEYVIVKELRIKIADILPAIKYNNEQKTLQKSQDKLNQILKKMNITKSIQIYDGN